MIKSIPSLLLQQAVKHESGWKVSGLSVCPPETIKEDTKLEMDMVKMHCTKLSELIDI